MDEKELLQVIQQATEEQTGVLDLSNKGLTALPPEIGQLINLKYLDIAYNKLTELPDEICNLTNLEELDLSSNCISKLPAKFGKLKKLSALHYNGNQLTHLPEEITDLSNLSTLAITGNQLTTLPSGIRKLTELQLLYAFGNELVALPAEIGKLTLLMSLGISNNQLCSLPLEIGRLSNLSYLNLNNNRLTELPLEMSNLTGLIDLTVENNPLKSPPPEIVKQGARAILSYLRERTEGSVRQWVSKLLVVGEGGVGKTSLLRALRGEAFNDQESTTHGIEIRSVKLPHPDSADISMELNTWDFGGQEIYHATHQFFLTNRSLFLLVWNARHGFQQGKLYYWLDTIQALAPDSPILLVATWIDERDADIPLGELRSKYPQIINQCEISNRTGAGVDALRSEIASAAARLPLMGEIWPATWVDAANAIRKREEKHITPVQMSNLMAEYDVTDTSAVVLARWLHELGDILYFRDNDDLNDTVILKPHWVTQYISMVLESKEVIDRFGIFTREHMDVLWSQLEPGMREHFLRLMERFDLSYRTLENREISLIVERLPFDPPAFAEMWEAPKVNDDCNEIAMKFILNTIPAGIPTWFIARSHRFTTHTHWRNGALFEYEVGGKHLALAQSFPHDRYLKLAVRGANPQNFFALLKDGLEVTLARFPGLQITRLIPCPGHDGEPCSHEFDYEQLLKRVKKKPMIECPQSLEDVSVTGLLFGLHWTTQDAVLSRIDELESADAARHDEVLSAIENLRVLAQREFTNAFRREQARAETYCPNIFTLRPSNSVNWMGKLFGKKMELQLLCQEPGFWHATDVGQPYPINHPAEWIKTMAPYIRRMFSVLKYAAPLVGPWIGVLSPENYKKRFEDDIKLMEELIKKLPNIEDTKTPSFDDPRLSVTLLESDVERVEGASLRALRSLLDEQDPQQQWAGLERTITPEGHYLWLCPHHLAKYAQ